MKKSLLLTIIILAAATVSAGSFYNAEVSINGGSTNNLFKTSPDTSDIYTTFNGSMNLYPLEFAEINLFSEYTKYSDFSQLSNFRYGGGFSLIPMSDSSKIKLYITTSYSLYKYKDALTTNSSEFSDKNISSIVSLGYELSPSVNIRTGYNFNSTGYANDEVSDKNNNEVFTGINITAFGQHSFDFEGGYSFEKYDYLPEYMEVGDTLLHYGVQPNRAYSSLVNGDLKSIYFSARLSRPLGDKTGMSMTYSYRDFTQTSDSAVLYGYSTGYLSPWLKSYEGSSYQLKFKTYMIPRVIVSAGYGYWDKAYLNVLETILVEIFDPFTMETTQVPVTNTGNANFRKDDVQRYFITIQLPIVTSSGRFFEPTLNIEYTNNNSNINNYDYTDFTISTGINIRL